MGIAVSSVDKYDFRNIKSNEDLEKIPAAGNQTFEVVHLQKNLRNGSQILDLSFELHNNMIELAITSREAEDKGGDKSDDDTNEEDEEGEEQEQEEEEDEKEEEVEDEENEE